MEYKILTKWKIMEQYFKMVSNIKDSLRKTNLMGKGSSHHININSKEDILKAEKFKGN